MSKNDDILQVSALKAQLDYNNQILDYYKPIEFSV